MVQKTTASGPPATGRKIRRRSGTGCVRSLSQLAFLASSCLFRHPSTTTIIIAELPRTIRAEPHSTIPRSNNRYTHYSNGAGTDGGSSSLSSLSSPLNDESYRPPWNPSPNIDPHGFLTDLYPRSPGEWEDVANIRGRHGPRNRARRDRLLSVPVRVRQVPGDGNCLFHSVAACLHRAANGTHLPMDTREGFGELRGRSLRLRGAAVDALRDERNGGRRRLFLQGEEWLEASELLSAAAAQFDLAGEEYCELMRKESYWGGGPEIVALCNYLQRPIHIYELIPAEEATGPRPPPPSDDPPSSPSDDAAKTSTQFSLRRMACFGSPRFDRREPLHILSADSRFPDVEPRRIRRVGNHFLALFPATSADVGVAAGGAAGGGLRRLAPARGGSRGGAGGDGLRKGGSGGEIGGGTGRWDGGRGSWTHGVLDWFVYKTSKSPK